MRKILENVGWVFRNLPYSLIGLLILILFVGIVVAYEEPILGMTGKIVTLVILSMLAILVLLMIIGVIRLKKERSKKEVRK
jgi:formate hydrogenlyase subunit 4